jgi:hypothetical protein
MYIFDNIFDMLAFEMKFTTSGFMILELELVMNYQDVEVNKLVVQNENEDLHISNGSQLKF